MLDKTSAILLIFIFNIIKGETKLPREVFCVDQSCSNPVVSGVLLREINFNNHKLEKNKRVEIVAKSADNLSSLCKIKVSNQFWYIDSSFISEVEHVNSNLKKFINHDNVQTAVVIPNQIYHVKNVNPKHVIKTDDIISPSTNAEPALAKSDAINKSAINDLSKNVRHGQLVSENEMAPESHVSSNNVALKSDTNANSNEHPPVKVAELSEATFEDARSAGSQPSSDSGAKTSNLHQKHFSNDAKQVSKTYDTASENRRQSESIASTEAGDIKSNPSSSKKVIQPEVPPSKDERFTGSCTNIDGVECDIDKTSSNEYSRKKVVEQNEGIFKNDEQPKKVNGNFGTSKPDENEKSSTKKHPQKTDTNKKSTSENAEPLQFSANDNSGTTEPDENEKLSNKKHPRKPAEKKEATLENAESRDFDSNDNTGTTEPDENEKLSIKKHPRKTAKQNKATIANDEVRKSSAGDIPLTMKSDSDKTYRNANNLKKVEQSEDDKLLQSNSGDKWSTIEPEVDETHSNINHPEEIDEEIEADSEDDESPKASASTDTAFAKSDSTDSSENVQQNVVPSEDRNVFRNDTNAHFDNNVTDLGSQHKITEKDDIGIEYQLLSRSNNETHVDLSKSSAESNKFVKNDEIPFENETFVNSSAGDIDKTSDKRSEIISPDSSESYCTLNSPSCQTDASIKTPHFNEFKTIYSLHHVGLMQCLFWASNLSRYETGINSNRSPFSKLVIYLINYLFGVSESFTYYIPMRLFTIIDQLFNSLFSLSLLFVLAWAILFVHLILIYHLTKFIVSFTKTCLYGGNHLTNSLSLNRNLQLEEYNIQLKNQLDEQARINDQLSKWSKQLAGSLDEMQFKHETNMNEIQKTTSKYKESVVQLKSQLADAKTDYNQVKTELTTTLIENEEKLHLLNSKLAELENVNAELKAENAKSIEELTQVHNKSIDDLKEEHEQLYSQATSYYNRMKAMQGEVDKILESKNQAESKLLKTETELQSLLASFNTLKSFELILKENNFKENNSSDASENEEESKSNESINTTTESEILNKLDDQDELKNKLKTSLSTLLDIGRLKAELKMKDEQLGVQDSKIALEHELRVELESKCEALEKECSNLKESLSTLEQDKVAVGNKLLILSDYFKERETELQRDLGKQALVGSESSEALNYVAKLNQELELEIQMLREKMSLMKKEVLETERLNRKRIMELDKRSHENWLAARAADNQIKELREENSCLRRKLIDTEMNSIPPALRAIPPNIKTSPSISFPAMRPVVSNNSGRSSSRSSLCGGYRPNLPDLSSFPFPPPPPPGMAIPPPPIPPGLNPERMPFSAPFIIPPPSFLAGTNSSSASVNGSLR